MQFSITKSRLYLLLLAALGITLRLPLIWNGDFAYMYDHAKDSLATLAMLLTKQPALSGPVTSIPGVFNGPFLYYVSAPLFLFFKFQPIAFVITVILLSACMVFLLRKHLLVALFWVTSVGLIGSQTSAWSPYLTPFIVLLSILLLKQIHAKNNHTKPVLGLAFLAGLTFHFQTAFGVVWVPALFVSLFLLKTKVSLKTLLLAGCIFFSTFALFGVFEVRHQFHQSTQIINFVLNLGSAGHAVSENKQGVFRAIEVLDYSMQTAAPAVLPISIPKFLSILITLLLIYFSVKFQRKSFFRIYLPLLLVPCIGYLLLPVKAYYFIAFMPIWIWMLSDLLSTKFKYISALAVVYILLAGIHFGQGMLSQQKVASQERIFYAPKQQAVNWVYNQANKRPFAVYHLVPEVYDYPYQYLYIQYSLTHSDQKLPVEFTYLPGKSEYVAEKAKILARLPTSNEKPQAFYAIEEAGSSADYHQEWWQTILTNYSVKSSQSINAAITVYELQPKN